MGGLASGLRGIEAIAKLTLGSPHYIFGSVEGATAGQGMGFS
jgi:hypothetical protein